MILTEYKVEIKINTFRVFLFSLALFIKLFLFPDSISTGLSDDDPDGIQGRNKNKHFSCFPFFICVKISLSELMIFLRK